MKEMGRYRVTGTRIYRGHPPGTEFEASLDPNAAQRAINRGSITLLEKLHADLPRGRYKLPAGWPNRKELANG